MAGGRADPATEAGGLSRVRGSRHERGVEREPLREVFATDIWVRRAILGDPTPWHPLSLPFDEMTPDPAVLWDRDARPSLDEVLALRADRMQTVRRVIESLTEEKLASDTEPVDGPGYPDAGRYPVAECLGTGAERGVGAPPLRGA